MLRHSAAAVEMRGLSQLCVVFFCSSAGEYEQAKPLIDRLRVQNVYTHIVFFSKAGLAYAEAKSEDSSVSLAASDSVWDWGGLFAALRPNIVVVVRHELWPGFLHAACNYAPTVLVDASRSLGETSSKLKRFVRGQLLRYFDSIYVVDASDARFFQQQYALPERKLVVTGDTKYDRVLERARQLGGAQALRTIVNASSTAPKRRLVVGSSHPADLAAVGAAYKLLQDSLGKTALEAWQLIVAPHHVDPQTIQTVKSVLEADGWRVARYSDLEQGLIKHTSLDVIILDRMGLLAEAYSLGELAFVGGAMHYQVHNVLEPASHGLALAFGPFYKNSQEAEKLVDAGLATVCPDAAAIAAWWQSFLRQPAPDKQVTRGAVQALAGASELILQDWKRFFNVR